MPTQPETTAQLAQEFYSNDIFLLLLTHIGQYEFEVSSICSCSHCFPLTLSIGTEGCGGRLHASAEKTDRFKATDGGILEQQT